jgi:hypothetical protein
MAPHDDETNITDIELLPDGRIFIFGASSEVLEVLSQLQNTADPAVAARLEKLGDAPAEGTQFTPHTGAEPEV